MRSFVLAVPLLFAAVLPSAQEPAAPPGDEPTVELTTGPWSAWLWCDTGAALYFEMEIQRTAEGGYRTFVENAAERIEVPSTLWRRTPKDEHFLRLGFPHYDSFVRARLERPGHLKGTWFKARGGDQPPRRVHFLATAGEADRFPAAVQPGTFRSVTGRWSVRFEDDETPGVMVLRQEERGTHVEGTVLTSTGDHRFLEGRIDRGFLRLSTFDGAHAFLYVGEFDGDALVGTFFNGNWYRTEWRAERDGDATLPDPLGGTRWLEGAALGDLAFPQLDGNVRSLVDPEWAGRPTILNLFGSWCPNCHDEAELLEELKRAYGEQGLHVAGLAFELVGPMERSVDQVARFRMQHELTYPTMVAGHVPKTRSTRALGTIDGLRSYPTSIFFRRDGSVAGVHTGFVGPAGGDEHLAERARFEELTQEVLASAPFDAAAAAEAFARAGDWRGHDARVTPSGNELRTTGAHDVVLSYTVNHDGDRSARFVPGGLWLGDELLRVDAARRVAWNPADLDRSFVAGAVVDSDELAHLTAEDATLRRAALLRLAHARRGEGAFPEAVPLLADQVPFVQVAAAWAVGFARTPEAQEALLALAGDHHAPLAREVERALSRL